MKTDFERNGSIRFQDAWVDVSSQAADQGFAAQVHLSRAAWMAAVYFVRDLKDRLDPVRENWRLGRLLQEVGAAISTRARVSKQRSDLPVYLVDGFDRLRSLELPGAQLLVRIDRTGVTPGIWIGVARDAADAGVADLKQPLPA